MLSFSTCSILLGLSILPLNSTQIHFLEKTFYRYLILGIVFGLEFILLIFANIKLKMKGKKAS